jgi:hypothetical protein
MTTTQSFANKQYYLQDSRANVGDNLMFWAKHGGYTSNVSAADLFSEDEAFRQNHSRPSDIPWPSSYIDTRTRLVVDMQYVKADEAQTYTEDEMFYLQSPGRDYIGNDILFLSDEGKKYTTDLNKAKVFSRRDVPDESDIGIAGIRWPKTYIDLKCRPAADHHDVSIGEALPLSAMPLAKQACTQHNRYRCIACGIFMSAEGYYGAPCKNCSCENRP